jgi:hypothetical protein
MTTPIERLKHYVTGAIERGEAAAITEQPSRPKYLYDWEHDSGRIVFPDGSQCFLQGEEAFHVFEQVEACAGPRADQLQTDILNEYSEVADVFCTQCKLWVSRGGHWCGQRPQIANNVEGN